MLSLPTLGDLSDPEIKPTSLVSPTLAGEFFTTNVTWENQVAKVVVVQPLSHVQLFATPW